MRLKGRLRRSLRWLFLVAICLQGVMLHAAPIAENPGLAAASSSVAALAKVTLSYAAVLASLSTVAMAFVELIKALVDLRSRFQNVALNRWLGDKKDAVLPELLYLAIGDKSHESVLCGQPIEKMMGQIQAAARIGLDYPEAFPNFFSFLTTSDFETAPEGTSIKMAAPRDRQAWIRNSRVVRDVSQHLGSGVGSSPSIDVAAASDAAQARARLASLVGRKLDGFQLRVDFWWTRTNQMLGIIVSVILVEWLVVPNLSFINTIAGYTLGLIGGLLAPFAKDLSQSLAGFASK